MNSLINLWKRNCYIIYKLNIGERVQELLKSQMQNVIGLTVGFCLVFWFSQVGLSELVRTDD